MLMAGGFLVSGSLPGTDSALAAKKVRTLPFRVPAFRNELEANLTSTGKRMWLSVLGVDRKLKLRTGVYEWRHGSWKALPGRPRTNHVTPWLATYRPGGTGRTRLCVGDEVPGKELTRARCFVNGRWKGVGMPRYLRTMVLSGFWSGKSSFTALFHEAGESTAKIQLARFHRGRLVPFGKPLELPGQYVSTIGEKTSNLRGGEVDVALEVIGASEATADTLGDRFVATFSDGEWTLSPSLPKLQMGPQPSGMVRTPTGMYFSATEAFVQGPLSFDWPFSVFRMSDGEQSWKRVGRVLDVGPGSAQGGVFASGKDVWTVWSEQVWKPPYGYGPISVYAARINQPAAGIGRPLKLWSGKALLAGITQAISYRNGTAFLFMRQFRRGGRAQYAAVALKKPGST